QDFFTEDPYSQLSKYILEPYTPDKELYNFLFKAVVNQEKSVDISNFEIADRQIMDTVSCLYEQAGYQLFYLYRVKWSQDYKTINFTYLDYTEEEIKEYQDILYSQMNHLLYNVAPEDYTPMQRFFAVFDYITKLGNYTDDMSDETTFSAGSILVNQKGICGGFSILANYALNFVGIPTEYISNEPHAWNMVTLDGNRYHTDFTWGAGNAYSGPSSLNTVLMDDQARMAGLDSMGFGDFPIIVGYPGDNPITPEPATDTRYDFYQSIYENYALDIENDWIYYYDRGIYRSHLDGTGKELIDKQFGYQFSAYNGDLYYIGDPNGLYQYESGKPPVLLDNTIEFEYTKIENGILKYGKGTEKEKEINLNDFSAKQFPQESSNQKQPINVSNRETFQIEITFSGQMNTSNIPTKSIGLLNNKGESTPLHLTWNDTGDKLTLRSKTYINKEPRMTLYVIAGIEDNNGLLTEDNYKIDITFTQ
ncbi:MAG: transglutaminase domain-containing protein, partial [Mobilitalea sp.]